MDDFINYLSAHPVALVVIAAVALLFIYLILRNMLKFILITGFVLVILGLAALYGYYHYSGEPEKFLESVREIVDKIGDQSEQVIEAGKDVVEKVGKSIKEGRSAPAGK
ncbi:MAG: hypothetical protein PHY29_05215 [Syntrophales bacterium]|jgi:Flp pilus assembly protein TadB|nr:hypothetical protein [Syntrophales bacterium]